MNKLHLLLGLFLSLIFCNPIKADDKSFKEQAHELVSKMSLEEKIGQLNFDAPAVSHLNIPRHNYWNECLHGVARAGLATVFPQAIGMAAMWDKPMMFQIANSISDEARAKNRQASQKGLEGMYKGLTFWTPNINLFRDPRWGRGMETYGEDPYLTGELGVGFIKGLQGDDPKYLKVVATAKHFVVHSGPESQRHTFNALPSDRDFLLSYSPHYKKAVQEGGVYSVMCAYNRYKDLPCCGSKYLENILRNEWGFNGYIVSDCGAVEDFFEKNAHKVVQTAEQASAMAVQAGTDLVCGDVSKNLAGAVKQGLITESEINVSVERMMEARLRLGLFAPKGAVKYDNIPLACINSTVHQQLALESAQKSMVLLKNDNKFLPLSKSVKRVAVIGPNADNIETMLGNYNGFPSNPVTPYQAIKSKLPQADVKYAMGTQLAPGLPQMEAIPTECLFTDNSLTKHGLKASYYTNDSLTGKPFQSVNDKQINFNWWDKAPFDGMSALHFSVKWEGFLVVPEDGEYAIGTEGYLTYKFYLDNKLISNYNNPHSPQIVHDYMTLKKGVKYAIRIEYKQNNTEYAMMRLLWEKPSTKLKENALALAKNSDVVVMCMGISPRLEGEEMKVKVEGFNGGDRVTLGLPKNQVELIQEVKKLGKPMVLVLMNGSALSIPQEDKLFPAILEAWYPGQAGGTAIADVLFGDYNPSGRLPVTFYNDVKDISSFDNYDMEGKTYRYFKEKPLYEFGFGLSYTTFAYSNIYSDKTTKGDKPQQVTVDVKNTGKFKGDEVVQLYLTHINCPYTMPIRSLEGFQRIHLNPGETKSVTFTLKPEQLAVLNNKNQFVVESGEIQLSIGGSQPSPQALINKQVIQTIITIIK